MNDFREDGREREKEKWMLIFPYSLPNLASMQDRHAHTARRRAMSALYSKSTILKNKALAVQMTTIIRDRLFPTLKAHSVGKTLVDMHRAMVATPTDIISAFIFGLSRSTDLLSDDQAAMLRMRQYHIRYFYAFFFQEYPGVWHWLERLGWNVIPKEVNNAGPEIEHWILAICDRAEQSLKQGYEQGTESDTAPEEDPLVYAHLRTAIQGSSVLDREDRKWAALSPEQRDDLASEMVDAACTYRTQVAFQRSVC